MSSMAMPGGLQPQKAALTYREVEELGFCSERTLRTMVANGAVCRSVLRPPGTRIVRFLRDVLIEELQAPAPRR